MASTNRRGKIWFKAKHYGWGWYPASWEGWLVIFVYIVLLTTSLYPVEWSLLSASDMLITALMPQVALTLILIIICYLKGEPPEWRWGK